MKKAASIIVSLLITLSFGITTSAESFISSIFLLLDDGGPITTEQTIRLSLWSDGRIESGDETAGVINTGAPYYGGFQVELTLTPDSLGRLLIPFGDIANFPELTPNNQFMMVEYKDSGDPVTSYVLYTDTYINSTTLDRFPLIESGVSPAQEVYTNHATDADTFTLDKDNDATDITIQFGETLAESIKWSSTNTRFELSDDARVEGNLAVVGQGFIAADHTAANSDGYLNLGRNGSNWELFNWNSSSLQFELSDDLSITGGIEVTGDIDFNLNESIEMRVENLASAPTCDGSSIGLVYQNTTDGNTYACDGSSFQILNNTNSTHYHNGSLANNIVTATVTNETTDGENTTVYLTDDGTSGGNLLFSSVYHVSVAASEIQSLAEAPVMAGYSYNSGTGLLTVKFVESAGILLRGQGLEAEEANTPITIFVIGI